jgi:hypothetical protein
VSSFASNQQTVLSTYRCFEQTSFHPDLQAAIENLKEDIAKEDWSQKGKFPPNIRPKLCEVAKLAIQLDDYDEHFFELLPRLFPYNKFTMTVSHFVPCLLTL